MTFKELNITEPILKAIEEKAISCRRQKEIY